jgi:hypothetical protein
LNYGFAFPFMRETIPNLSNVHTDCIVQVVSKLRDVVAKRKWYCIRTVFVQGILLIAANKTPIIVNLHSASGVIVCSKLEVGITE